MILVIAFKVASRDCKCFIRCSKINELYFNGTGMLISWKVSYFPFINRCK